MEAELIVGPDPTVVQYITAGAMVAIAFSLLICFACAIIVLFSEGKIKVAHIPYLGVGLGIVIYVCYFSIPALTAPQPTLSLKGNVLKVGDTELVLDDSTEIFYLGKIEALDIPDAKDRGYAAMPEGMSFPPKFTGGPVIRVTSGGREVSFKPLLYGPLAYLESARPEAAEFMQQLVKFGKQGNARRWLEKSFAPVEKRKDPVSFNIFLIIFFAVSTPFLGLLGTAVVIGIRKKFFV